MTTPTPDPSDLPRQRILIVDDKASNLFALENVLREVDADVVRADSGQKALAKVLEQSFALIILDVRMPGMDGFEVAEHLKGDPETRQIPIIFLTAEYPDQEHIFKGYETGAIDYMLKPYSPRILLSKVRVLLEIDRDKEELRRYREYLTEEVQNRTGQLLEANRDLELEVQERKRKEEENLLLATAFSQAAEAMMITDIEARIEFVNPAFEATTGYSREEVIGQNPRFLKSGEQSEAFYQEMWATILSGRTWAGRMVNRRKGGDLYTEDATISPVKDPSGDIVCFVGITRDVTDEIHLEEQVRQSQKMDSIGQLVSGVAHDFNNLLQVINGFTEIAQLKAKAGESVESSLEEVSKAGERAKDLVAQLLAFSRQQVISPQILDLNKEIGILRKTLGRLIGEHIELRFLPDDSIDRVYLDKGQLNQLVMNLVVNARDAMPEGGILTLETGQHVFKAEELEVGGLSKPGRYIALRILDTGQGMPPEVLNKVFEPFFTTKEQGKGTGLGLSTVYGIVKQSEGNITVDSKEGKGSTFTLYFPAVEEEADDESGSSDEVDSMKGGTETILVAEDEEMLLNLTRLFLEEEGYTVIPARDGMEAVDLFEQNADQIDLVMMDVVMPRMGGKKAMEAILEKRPDLPHLFVSGYSPDAGHNDFIQDKHYQLLNKPYQASTMLEKIREVLESSRPADVIKQN
jgi:PAS domain S-box-containing protein